MEQKPDQPWRAAAALVAAALFALGIALFRPVGIVPDEQSAQAAGQAVLSLARPDRERSAVGKVGATLVPLGRTVGIKLFSDGVLVVGLSDIETQEKTVSPAKEMGLKVGVSVKWRPNRSKFSAVILAMSKFSTPAKTSAPPVLTVIPAPEQFPHVP